MNPQCEFHYPNADEWENETGEEFQKSLRCPRNAVFKIDLIGIPFSNPQFPHEMCGRHTIEWAHTLTDDTEV